MTIRKSVLFVLTVLLLFNFSFSQTEGLDELSTPDVFATMAIGFNYDYLRSPLRVDYDRARGLFGINIPFAFKPSAEMTGQMLSGVSDNFTDGEFFEPSVAVKQFANTTLQVDVPFFGGVLQWSHMRMMNISYNNQISLSNFRYQPDSLPGAPTDGDVDLSMLLTGNISVPLGFNLGWETMTFGYAYKINEMFSVALNMHRHYFHFNILGNVDMDLVGNIGIETTSDDFSVTKDISIDYALHNQVDGFYDLKRWTPTIAASAWRFQFIARFGFTSHAKGALYGGYSVPFFVDPETFELESFDQEYIEDNLGNFENNDTVATTFSTTNDLLWEMPSGFTLGFDIVPEKLNISYTKFAGSIRMELVDEDFQKEGDNKDQDLDSLNFRFGAQVDHIILLQGHFPRLYFNTGIFSFDASFGDSENLLGNADAMIQFGSGVMLPILGGGIILGDKMQFKGEINLAPFPAINTGIIYHF